MTVGQPAEEFHISRPFQETKEHIRFTKGTSEMPTLNTTSIVMSVTKLVVAVALTIAVITSSGVVAEQVGLDVTPSVYACGGNNGGGC